MLWIERSCASPVSACSHAVVRRSADGRERARRPPRFPLTETAM